MATSAAALPTLRRRAEAPRAINRDAVDELGLQLPLHRGCSCHYATMPYRGELHLFLVDREGACERCRQAAQKVLLRIIRGA
jgi:hypothetical protein